jgi:two-component system, chemotaxis family, protein-glutamate methylesterase/glutaminase
MTDHGPKSRPLRRSGQDLAETVEKLRLNELLFAAAADYPIPRLEGNCGWSCGQVQPSNFSRHMKEKSISARRLKKPVQVLRPEFPLTPASRVFPVIAMAASAGGLNALSVILGGLPANFPAAIAIVMHLAPEHKSILAEILNSRTHLAVKQAHTGDVLSRGSVFIAPPNHHLSVVEGGRLKLSSSAAEKFHFARPSAEPLFASVAEIYKRRAIAVVLTGGDGDGSFGVQIIKERGGTVIAQDRPTSQDFSMPETSIKTGDVDFILPLHEIAPKLIELVGFGSE